MNDTVLIVPGYRGSGPAHWQTWVETKLPGSRRVKHINWGKPELAVWSTQIHHALDESVHPVWIIAHSFGCLASAVAAAEDPEKIAGIILVAPADPELFSPDGIREYRNGNYQEMSVADLLPEDPLPSGKNIMITSRNDPWLSPERTRYWAKRWGCSMINLGNAGHINADSGYGPWPFLLELLDFIRERQPLTLPQQTDESGFFDAVTTTSPIKWPALNNRESGPCLSFMY